MYMHMCGEAKVGQDIDAKVTHEREYTCMFVLVLQAALQLLLSCQLGAN